MEREKITHIYKGPRAPLPCLCLSLDACTVYAGCWDKLIWSWEVSTGTRGKTFRGHTDFVKAVLYFQDPWNKQDRLVSGGAEGDILVWDVTNGQRLAAVKGGSRAIQCLAQDPLSNSSRIFVSFSNPEIKYLDLENLAVSPPILAHATSVHKLLFDADGDLWTASADQTAKHLVRNDKDKADRDDQDNNSDNIIDNDHKDWETEDAPLHHPDFVRDLALHEPHGWLITACRDENIRVWDIATGKLHHTFVGHFGEVTGLCLLSYGYGQVVSVSIDGTMRRWDLESSALKRPGKREGQRNGGDEAINDQEKNENNANASLMTEEEEAELEELMRDDGS